MECPTCGALSVRTSRFRSRDLFMLIRFRFPVRCHNCMERVYVGLMASREVSRETKAHREKAQLEQESR
jgi:hypothetical protein